MPKKLTYEFIKEQFEKENYKLLTTEYINNSQKLEYICPKGHRHSINWNNWKTGNRCPYCSGYIKHNIEFIKSMFQKEGYTVLDGVYKNNKQKLNYICLEGHNHYISWHEWEAGHRCPYCTGNAKLTIEYIKKEFEKGGYKLLSKQYKNCYQKLDYICPNNHKHNISWSSWQQYHRCPYCNGQGKLTIEFVRSEFERVGYVLLSNNYINKETKLDYICSNGHKHSITWHDWRSGRRCPTCAIINRSGKNHYNWKGGISCEPYCDAWADREFKESIKYRDNYQCQNPDCWHKDGGAAKLTIHHIDYVKKNCSPRNLITLCNSCNSRANVDRKNWQKFYINIMIKKVSING